MMTVIKSGGEFHDEASPVVAEAIRGLMTWMHQTDEEPLEDGDCLLGHQPGATHLFGGIIIQVDDLESSIKDIVNSGIEMAIDNEYQTVSMPTMRAGNTANIRETREEALLALIDVISSYRDSTLPAQIAIVVPKGSPDASFLREALDATT